MLWFLYMDCALTTLFGIKIRNLIVVRMTLMTFCIFVIMNQDRIPCDRYKDS